MKEKENTTPRFFVDIRVGCAAVRDSQHPKYSKNYPGLNQDLEDIVAWKQGVRDILDEWSVKEEDIDYLTNLCDSLNKGLSELTLPAEIQKIYYDLFKDGCLIFSNISGDQMMELRNQIAKKRLKGYSLKINSNSFNLFDKEVNIENETVMLTDLGEVENKWFSDRNLNGYPMGCAPESERLVMCIKLRSLQLDNEKK